MHSSFKKVYLYFLTLPDRSYPFASEVEGSRVRGRQSYEKAAARAIKTYGAGRLGYKLMLYRELFHFVGSVIFIVAATVLSNAFFGSETALYVLMAAAVAALSFQEFYVHPKHYEQTTFKGITDWLTWVTPMALYVLLFAA